jgi:hypothetical protein
VRRLSVRRQRAIALGLFILILAGSVWIRHFSVWLPHWHASERVGLGLAAKMGSRLGLDDYNLDSIELKQGTLGQNPPVQIISPYAPKPAPAASTANLSPFNAQFADSNPFKYRPPLLPSLLTYSHHQFLAPRFPYFPVVLSARDDGRVDADSRSAAALQQVWAVVVALAAGAALLVMVFILGWRCAGPWAGLAASWLTAVNPVMLLAGYRIWPEELMMAAAVAAVFLFIHFQSKNSWAGCGLAGFFFGLAFVADMSAIFFLPAILLRPTGKKSPSRRINPCLFGFVAGFLIISKEWIEHVYVQYREPFWTASRQVVADGNPLGGISFWVFWLTLVKVVGLGAALAGLGIWLRKSKPDAPHEVREPLMVAGWFALMILSFLLFRGLYAPNPVWWDLKALVPAIPIAAIAASAGITAAFRGQVIRLPNNRILWGFWGVALVAVSAAQVTIGLRLAVNPGGI